MGMVYPGGGGLKKLIEAGYVTEAPTLSELARKIGVDPAGLERTVAKMNQYSALGVDPEFGKGNEEIDREIGDPKHKRSEEHTSELQSLMRISYAVFCLKKKNNRTTIQAQHKQP